VRDPLRANLQMSARIRELETLKDDLNKRIDSLLSEAAVARKAVKVRNLIAFQKISF
jgi:hypothetical protein